MGTKLSYAVMERTIQYLEAEAAKGILRPNFDTCCSLGYPHSRSTFCKVRKPWLLARGILPEPPKGRKTIAYHTAIKELEGVEDIEERKRIVREMSAKEIRQAYGSRARNVGLSRARAK